MSRIIVVEPHPVTRRGLVGLLREAGHDIAATVEDGSGASDALFRLRPDILLMEVALAGGSAIELLRILRAEADATPVILLSARISDEELAEAWNLRAEGLLLKSCPEAIIVKCIDEVRCGRRWIDRTLVARIIAAQQKAGEARSLDTRLSGREQEIARLASTGKPNRYIAETIGIAEGTVKVHLHNIYQKVGVNNRTELAMKMENIASAEIF